MTTHDAAPPTDKPGTRSTPPPVSASKASDRPSAKPPARSSHDTRPPIRHVLDADAASGARSLERHLYIPATYVAVGKPSRLRVEYDPTADAMFAELVEIADEETTGESAHARRLVHTPRALHLTEIEVRWLHAQLGDVVQVLDAARPSSPPPPSAPSAPPGKP